MRDPRPDSIQPLLWPPGGMLSKLPVFTVLSALTHDHLQALRTRLRVGERIANVRPLQSSLRVRIRPLRLARIRATSRQTGAITAWLLGHWNLSLHACHFVLARQFVSRAGLIELQNPSIWHDCRFGCFGSRFPTTFSDRRHWHQTVNSIDDALDSTFKDETRQVRAGDPCEQQSQPPERVAQCKLESGLRRHIAIVTFPPVACCPQQAGAYLVDVKARTPRVLSRQPPAGPICSISLDGPNADFLSAREGRNYQISFVGTTDLLCPRPQRNPSGGPRRTTCVTAVRQASSLACRDTILAERPESQPASIVQP